MRLNLFVVLLTLLFGGASFLCAQQPQGQQPQQGQPRQQTPQPPQAGQVIELEAQVIDARVELPQVQILDRRKKSDFEEVTVDKSFATELSGKTEELKFTPLTSGKIKPIKNIDLLLNKSRF